MPSKDMETYQIRRVNLRQLLKQWGGPGVLGAKLGHKSGSFLSQLAGPNPSREVTEQVARGIEQALDLPSGWMDHKHRAEGGGDVDSAVLGQVVSLVGALVGEARIRLSSDQFADLVTLAYEDMQAHGTLRETYVRRLLRLTGGSSV